MIAENGASFQLLMKRADAALYNAKEAGKGTFRFATVEAVAREITVS